MANTERLKALRTTVEADRDRLNMANWAVKHTCGTTLCLAGFAAVLSGAELNFDDERAYHFFDGRTTTAFTTTGETVEDVAREFLELDEEDAAELFYTNDEDLALDKLDHLIEYGDLVSFDDY